MWKCTILPFNICQNLSRKLPAWLFHLKLCGGYTSSIHVIAVFNLSRNKKKTSYLCFYYGIWTWTILYRIHVRTYPWHGHWVTLPIHWRKLWTRKWSTLGENLSKVFLAVNSKVLNVRLARKHMQYAKFPMDNNNSCFLKKMFPIMLGFLCLVAMWSWIDYQVDVNV